ncbi:phosphoribosylformylglycinamidine synthase subunit PurQ [Escherichia coli]|uniref:phosphoribosylformylglycinamidine synthase subunit PurQ n=1 Tax=Escherichia coli TaxID=562 RepID=UPI0024ADE3A6|nr:phosphoribosylformylglycinamidine synthase subunit PurQ [Escherichia coli]
MVACGGFSYGDVLGAGEGWRSQSCSMTVYAMSLQPLPPSANAGAGVCKRLPDDV